MTNWPSEAVGADRFLITGCQRSGTTLVGMALEAHPQVNIVQENTVPFHSQGKVTLELNLEALASHRSHDSVMSGYSAPRDSHRTEEIEDVLPLGRVLWIERELRQVVASMLALRWDNGCWAELYAPREIRKHIVHTGDERALRSYESIDKMDQETVRATALATLCWLVKREQRKAASLLHGDRMLRVDYNQLVAQPGSILGEILRFLQLEWSDLVLDHPASIAPGLRAGRADPGRPVDSGSLNKWKRLSQTDLEVIATISNLFRDEPT